METHRPKGLSHTHTHTHVDSVQCWLTGSSTLIHSDNDGGYIDMNKEESAQYVAMKELSYADIEPAVYETPYTPAGDGRTHLWP